MLLTAIEDASSEEISGSLGQMRAALARLVAAVDRLEKAEPVQIVREAANSLFVQTVERVRQLASEALTHLRAGKFVLDSSFIKQLRCVLVSFVLVGLESEFSFLSHLKSRLDSTSTPDSICDHYYSTYASKHLLEFLCDTTNETDLRYYLESILALLSEVAALSRLHAKYDYFRLFLSYELRDCSGSYVATTYTSSVPQSGGSDSFLYPTEILDSLTETQLPLHASPYLQPRSTEILAKLQQLAQMRRPLAAVNVEEAIDLIDELPRTAGAYFKQPSSYVIPESILEAGPGARQTPPELRVISYSNLCRLKRLASNNAAVEAVEWFRRVHEAGKNVRKQFLLHGLKKRTMALFFFGFRLFRKQNRQIGFGRILVDVHVWRAEVSVMIRDAILFAAAPVLTCRAGQVLVGILQNMTFDALSAGEAVAECEALIPDIASSMHRGLAKTIVQLIDVLQSGCRTVEQTLTDIIAHELFGNSSDFTSSEEPALLPSDPEDKARFEAIHNRLQNLPEVVRSLFPSWLRNGFTNSWEVLRSSEDSSAHGRMLRYCFLLRHGCSEVARHLLDLFTAADGLVPVALLQQPLILHALFGGGAAETVDEDVEELEEDFELPETWTASSSFCSPSVNYPPKEEDCWRACLRYCC